VFPAREKSSQFSETLNSPGRGSVTVPPAEKTPCHESLTVQLQMPEMKA
jgi:hypothetical protein